jgi:hypothetical protein
MRAPVLILLAAAACGGGGDLDHTVVRATMALSSSSLDASSVRAVGITVVAAGPEASCPHVLRLAHPIDDPMLEIVAHGLFTVDGADSPSLRLPSAKPLLFYVEAFRSRDGQRPAIGRGCAEATLTGPQADVSVTLSDGS